MKAQNGIVGEIEGGKLTKVFVMGDGKLLERLRLQLMEETELINSSRNPTTRTLTIDLLQAVRKERDVLVAKITSDEFAELEITKTEAP